MGSSMEDPSMKCGIGNCHPKSFNVFTNILTFTLLYSLSGVFTSTNSIYMSSQITTLEKFFGFTSTQSGFLMSCNDIGFLTTTLLVSYYARKWHIPRVLSIGGVIFGISGIICSLSYFLSPQSQRSVLDDSLNNTEYKSIQGGQICQQHNANISLLKCLDESETETKIGIATEFTPVAMVIFAIVLVIQGICKSPRQPFVATYIDDNVDKTQTAFYMGLTFALIIFGPAIAFGVGGLFSKTYVTLQDVGISPTHPQWIGAWWLGFVIFGALSAVASIPVLFFPRRLHPQKSVKAEYANESPFKGWLKALIRLLTNPIYVLCVINVCISTFIMAGFGTFGPKYIETQFSLPAWKANIILGIITILALSLGAFVGGFITSKLKLSPMGCIKALVLANILGLLLTLPFYIFGCANPEIVGLNRSPDLLNKTCLNSCACDDKDYFVVCGSDGRNYFSPCYAGCTSQMNMLYTNCSCIEDGGWAYPGLCDSNCPMLYPYIGLSLVAGFIGLAAAMPAVIFFLRAVSDKDKAMAIGISTFLQTLLGHFPGPIVMGKLVDTTCTLWTESCSKKGACAVYDNDKLRVTAITAVVLCNAIEVIFSIVIFWISRSKTDWSTESNIQTGNKNETKKFVDKSGKLQELEDPENEEFLPMNGVKE